MIYLASPYSHKFPPIRWYRYIRTCIFAAKLMSKHLQVYSPIAHSHPVFFWGGLFGHKLPYDFEYWQAHNQWHLERCSAVYVYMLPGWMESKGVTAEVEAAKAMGKRVRHIG